VTDPRTIFLFEMGGQGAPPPPSAGLFSKHFYKNATEHHCWKRPVRLPCMGGRNTAATSSWLHPQQTKLCPNKQGILCSTRQREAQKKQPPNSTKRCSTLCFSESQSTTNLECISDLTFKSARRTYAPQAPHQSRGPRPGTARPPSPTTSTSAPSHSLSAAPPPPSSRIGAWARSEVSCCRQKNDF